METGALTTGSVPDEKELLPDAAKKEAKEAPSTQSAEELQLQAAGEVTPSQKSDEDDSTDNGSEDIVAPDPAPNESTKETEPLLVAPTEGSNCALLLAAAGDPGKTPPASVATASVDTTGDAEEAESTSFTPDDKTIDDENAESPPCVPVDTTGDAKETESSPCTPVEGAICSPLPAPAEGVEKTESPPSAPVHCIGLLPLTAPAEGPGETGIPMLAPITVNVPVSGVEMALLDPEKVALIQKHLLVLVHAHACLHLERELRGDCFKNCDMPYCKHTKTIVQHMMDCKNKEDCSFPQCIISWQLLLHYGFCRTPVCPVCKPFVKRPHICPNRKKEADKAAAKKE